MFSRRWIINYILVFLIVLFTWIGNKYGVETGYQEPPGVSATRPAEIQSIEIKTARAALELQRDPDGWLLTAPLQWPADTDNVTRLLDILTHKTESRLSADQIDPGSIGLDIPLAVMRLGDTRISFGDTNNIGERRYTRIDETVFLLPDIYLPFIQQGAAGVIDRRLLPRRFGIERLALPGLEIRRDAEGRWQGGAAGDYSAAQLQALVDNWQQLTATRVRAFDTTQTPRQKILALLDSGDRLEFYLMSIDPEIVIANPQIGLQYHFRADFYYQLIAPRRDETAA